jgi:DNA repair protein RecO (recombination protein O)
MPLYNDEAINIRTRPFAEADRLVILFTRTHGKISAVAKGARRPRSKFGGRLEVFTYNQVLLATGKNLDIISQCETIESFYKIREDRDKLNAGAYILRLADAVTEEGQRNTELFDLLLASLRELEKMTDPAIVCRAFEVKLSGIEGIMPSLEMLGRKFDRLPHIVEVLKSFGAKDNDLTQKDLSVAERVFKELLSDHVNFDVRRFTPTI